MSTTRLEAATIPELQPNTELRALTAQSARFPFAAVTRDQALAWQADCRVALAATVGFVDAPVMGWDDRPAPPTAEFVEEVDRGDFTRRKALLATGPNSFMPVYLLKSKDASGPLPLVIAYHGHGYGVKDIVGLWEDGTERYTPDGVHKDFAIELCRRGFLVAAPEIAGFGERQNDYSDLDTELGQQIPDTCHNAATYAFMLGKSLVGMRVRDGMRLLDWLGASGEIDPAHVGAMGLSGGGMLTFFHTCLDERIRACVISGYFTNWRDSILAMYHCTCNFVPGLLTIGELTDVVGLIAPRPLLVEVGSRDPIYPIGPVREAVGRTRDVYDALGRTHSAISSWMSSRVGTASAVAWPMISSGIGFRPDMAESALVGIDLGTSSVKSVVIDPNGKMLGCAAREYAVDTPRPGWAEQDPETWVSAALASVQQVMVEAGIAPGDVTGIGLSGQMHGMVCLDAAGRPLRPAIIWADQRSATQVARVARDIGPVQLGSWTGNPLATGFMLASWLWLREEEPDVARRVVSLLLPKDYLRYRLTGELATEPSDASSTLLFDTAARRWSGELLSALDVDADLLPPVRESAAVAGGLSSVLSVPCGLRAGTPVIHGGSDQAMQAVGHGVIAPGVISSTIGTGGQLFAPLSQPAYDPEMRLHLFCHAAPDLWHLEAAILAAGLSLRWLRDHVFVGMSYQEIADAAATAPPGAERLFFLPHLAGERTPHMDPAATGAFVGLTLRHTRAHLARAVMEGVVFALRQGLELMLALGGPAERVVGSGGATAHPLWLQLQADIYDRPIYRTKTIEAAATGAALLAGVGTRIYRDVQDGCAQAVTWDADVTAPNAERVAFYDEAYRTFCKLYPALSVIGF